MKIEQPLTDDLRAALDRWIPGLTIGEPREKYRANGNWSSTTWTLHRGMFFCDATAQRSRGWRIRMRGDQHHMEWCASAGMAAHQAFKIIVADARDRLNATGLENLEAHDSSGDAR